MRNAPQSVRSLGRYQLLFMLGQGGMGEVHLAKLTGAAGFEKLCIVKTILPQMQADQQFVERFHHEARVLVQLNHSNIAQVYDMGEVDGTLYMAIEYVPGVDLSRVEARTRRQQAVMPVPVALYLAQQVTEALGYAHRKSGPDGAPLGIVHRDVSPQNVMVSYEGEVKVIDFGLAKSAARSQHTLPQTVMGKLGYMSPEQAMARPVDYRSDIFSAGIVVWEMLAGRPLYGGGTMGEMLAQMAYPNIPSLRGLRPEISATLEQVVMRALQTEPAGRYARGDDFARALNELAVREGLTIGAEDVGNYVRAMCPEEFAAERQLQSRLSMLRKKAMTHEDPPEEVPIDAPGTEGTFLKPSQPGVPVEKEMTAAQRALSVVQPAATPAQANEADPNPGRGRTVVRKQPPGPVAAAPTAPQGRGRTVVRKPSTPAPQAAAEPAAPDQEDPHSEPIVIPKSRAPMVVAIVALVGLLGGGAWLALAPSGDSKPEVKREPAETPTQQTPTPSVTVTDAGAADEPANRNPETPKEAPKVNAPKRLDLVDLTGTLAALTIEDDRAIVLLKRNEKDLFREGEPVLIVGEPLDDGRHVPVYARATVIVATATLVKAAATEGEFPADLKLFMMKDRAARAARPDRPKNEPVARNDGDRVEPVKREPVKNEPVKNEPVKNEPVKNEPVKNEPVKNEPVKNEPTATKVAVRGAIGVSPPATGGQIIRIQNQSGQSLTGCSIRLTSNRTASVAALGAAEVRLMYTDFKPDPRPPDPQASKGWSAVVCKEGSGYFWTTWLNR